MLPLAGVLRFHCAPMTQTLAIAGPGLMGLGIAQVAAAAGMEVLLVGRDSAAALAGRSRLVARLQQQVERDRVEAGRADALLARIAPLQDDAQLARCDFAIESVPEDRTLKAKVLRRLQAALPAGALIATNTSGLPVSGLACPLLRPQHFIGLHFFSPVERMKLVEVVPGAATAHDTLRRALALVERLGQTPIVVRDGPGFFTSRVFAAYLDEALALLAEGVDPAAIDAAAVAQGRAIGPLALLDDISLALNLQQIRQARADGLPPERCRPLAEPVLAAMLAQGRGGRRQGGGFYEGAADGRRVPWPGLAALFPRAASQPDQARIGLRLRCAEAMEALRCLEQGVIVRAADADTASLLGLGFPKATGGLLHWVEHEGPARFVATCDALARRHGARFAPSPWLRACAAAGQGLAEWRSPNNERMSPA
jgi:3-hydroxyacyl-CoA dehydrogenase/enoyl-CoA hydratase/3-hydroxybutyryl-CoA epimerase